MSKTDTLTKIITFTPFFMIQNSVGKGVNVEVFEVENPEKVTLVEAGETRPFWPDHGANRVKIRVVGTSETEAFSLQKPSSTLLRLSDSKFGGVHAEVSSNRSPPPLLYCTNYSFYHARIHCFSVNIKCCCFSSL